MKFLRDTSLILASVGLAMSQPAFASVRSADSIPAAGLPVAASSALAQGEEVLDDIDCLEIDDRYVRVDEQDLPILDQDGEWIDCGVPPGGLIDGTAAAGGGLGGGLTWGLLGALALALTFVAIQAGSSNDSPG